MSSDRPADRHWGVGMLTAYTWTLLHLLLVVAVLVVLARFVRGGRGGA
jgi:hypothetical protein